MKKIYPLLALLLILASCSEWKYTKGIKWKQPEYQASKAKVADVERTTASVAKDEAQAENVEPATSEEITSETPVTEENTSGSNLQDAEEVTILVRDDDSLQTVSPEVVRMAFEAEDQGRKSRNLGIVGVALTVTYVLAFIGLILAIVGLIKGINSMKSRYNTPKGVSMARTGIITSSIVIGLYVLGILILAVALILLL